MLISVHFPKAGGTTLRKGLRDHFGASLLEDYGDRINHPPSQRLIDPIGYFSQRPTLAPGVRAVHGHFHPHKYAHIEGARFATFLRHPLTWVFSLYAHWYTEPPNGYSLQDYTIQNRLDVVRMAQMPLVRHCMTFTYFEGVDLDSFAFVGFHETRDEDLAAFGAAFGLSLDPAIHQRPTRPFALRDEAAGDPAVRATLRGILADDIAFYERQFLRRKGRPFDTDALA